MDDEINRLESLLAKLQLLDPPFRGSAEGKDLYQEICKLVLEEQLYIRLWSEPTLNQLEYLLRTEKPNQELFQSELDEIRKRTRTVKDVNDLFFAIVDPNSTSETLCKLLATFKNVPQDFDKQLESSGRLQEIRIQDMAISEKVELFLESLRDDLTMDLPCKEAFKEIVTSFKSREVVGKTNALLIRDTGKAITIPLQIKLQSGTGQVSCQIRGSEDFKDAVVRAHSAMRERGFLSASEDIFYTLELTDVRYQGSSLAVAAAVAMHDVKLNLVNDPYTAFTGDINLDGQEWRIKPVSGVIRKIEAAQFSGCRRVFIPRSNCAEVTTSTGVNIIGVESLADLFIQLRPGRQLLPSSSLQGRKVGALQQYCMNHGWDLSPPQPIQAGIQFTIAPLEVPPLKVQLYNTGHAYTQDDFPK